MPYPPVMLGPTPKYTALTFRSDAQHVGLNRSMKQHEIYY